MGSKMLDYAAIGKLLEDVEAEGIEIPEKFYPPDKGEGDYLKPARDARYELANDISWAFTIYNMHNELNSDAYARKYEKRHSEIKNKANFLIRFITDESINIHMLKESFARNSEVCFSDLIKALTQLENECDKELKRIKAAGTSLKAPFNVLFPDDDKKQKVPALMNHLKTVFEENFSVEAKIGQDSCDRSASKSPFTEFVRCIIHKMDLEQQIITTPAAIRKALQRGK